MKSLKPLSLLILIASALLLSDGTLGSANAQSESPSIRNSQNQEAKDQQSQTQNRQLQQNICLHSRNAYEAMPTPKGNQPNGNSQSWNDWFWQNLTGILLVLVGIWAARIAIGTLGPKLQNKQEREPLRPMLLNRVPTPPQRAQTPGERRCSCNSALS